MIRLSLCFLHIIIAFSVFSQTKEVAALYAEWAEKRLPGEAED